ncbi:MAG: hypothetical protein C0518_06465 [Opitutus sp.]|nr:hypothetical protein [Opitutus sp.]
MIERFIHRVATDIPDPAETAATARMRLGEKFPRTALRRMTHLGLLTGSALDGIALTPEDTLVYATTFAETRALEDFLVSFPVASPLLFQTSIHPGGVQQVMIGRQQPVGRLWPLAGGPRLVEHALQTVLLDPAARVVLAGGEERGTWMLELGMAAAQPFAFAVEFTREAAAALGKISFTPGDENDAPCPTLENFARALPSRMPLGWRGAGGAWAVTWS